MKQYLERTFLVLGRGFQFSTDPPARLEDPRNLSSSDPWTVLGCVLARARKGDLEPVSVLPDLMARNDEALVWNACVQLIGFVGRQQFVFGTAQRFLSDPGDRGAQWYISEMLLNACGLSAVEHLLNLHQAATERDARRHIQHCLSTLLEDQPGEVDAGPEESLVPDPAYPESLGEYQTVLDQAGYVDKVRSVSAQVRQFLATPDQPVTAGKPLDLLALVLRLYERLRSGEASTARMEWERMCFEAFTGVDCSNFYQKGRLQRLAAMAALEGFLDSGRAAQFEVGTRYFFAHRIEP